MTFVLGVDTASEFACAALYCPADGRVYESRLSESNSHDEKLADEVKSLIAAAGLAATDISLLVSGSGPGSFTGLRIGLSLMKGLSMGLGVPLVQVSSLEAFAHEFQSPARIVFSVLDARRAEVFLAAYRDSPEGPACLIKPCITSLAMLPEVVHKLCSAHNLNLSDAIICGSQPPDWPAVLPDVQTPRHAAASLCRLAGRVSGQGADALALSKLSPDYLRAVSAKTIEERRAEDMAGPRILTPLQTGA